MKIAIGNPPLSGPGVPLLSQNRQFQWYRSPVTSYTIYPVVPAYAATLLKTKGHDVLWEDCIAEKKSWDQMVKTLENEGVELVAIETKTPVVKQHWQIINNLKKLFPQMKLVLMGDHVSALPQESLLNCAVDYILVGGDFDFLLLSLADYLSGRRDNLSAGVYFKDRRGKIIDTGVNKLGYNLERLPMIDRKLTKWWLYSSGSSNFKYKPNTYTMIGRDCWWRRPGKSGKAGCSFCSWTSIFPAWNVGKPEQLLEEVGGLIDLGVKEVFDDTGTFPIGRWLHKFCDGMMKRGYHKKIFFGCNMRAGALEKKDFKLMKKAGFRFILYGLESVNDKTLEKLNKGTTNKELEKSLKWAKEAGLNPHVTIMFGYPWETKKEAQKTVDFVRRLFDKGYIDSLQATLLIPYPGTALFDEAKEKDWLLTEDWNRYDMGEPILKTSMSERELKEMVRACYHGLWSPKFMMRKLWEIRNFKDLSFYLFQATKYISKLLDFRPKKL